MFGYGGRGVLEHHYGYFGYDHEFWYTVCFRLSSLQGIDFSSFLGERLRNDLDCCRIEPRRLGGFEQLHHE